MNHLQSALFFVSYELYNIRNITINYIADIVQSIQCDAVIFSQGIQRTGAKVVIMNQLVLSDAFSFKGFPERSITNHPYHVLFYNLLTL